MSNDISEEAQANILEQDCVDGIMEGVQGVTVTLKENADVKEVLSMINLIDNSGYSVEILSQSANQDPRIAVTKEEGQ